MPIPSLHFVPLRRPSRFVDDVQLVAQVRAGRRDAFESIYDRHHAGILSFCRHMLGSPEEAEDVVQQTFAAAYGTLMADEREIALKPWLYAIARNGCLSVLRVQREHLSLEDSDARLPATVGLSVEVEQREDLRALLVDLQRLPEDQRAALILAELGAETHEEIALVLGVPAVKVRALIFQAREALMSRRLGRDADCGPIREQLAFLRGGARRRRELRHHVAQCAGCQAFEAETSRQRAGMAVLLPVAPTFALKQSSLAAAFAAGGSSAAQIGGAAAGGATAGGVTAGGVTAGGVTAGGVTAGGVAAGGAGSAYTVVGGALAGGSAAGGAAAGGAASIGGVAVLSGGGVLAGAKLVGLKALVGLALTGVTAGGYTAVRPADPPPPPQVAANVSNPSQKAAPKPPPPAGVVAPITSADCHKAVAGATECAVQPSNDPAAAGAGTSARPAETAPQGGDGDHDGAGSPTTQDADPEPDAAPTSQPAGPEPDGVPAADADAGDRDGDGIPDAEDGCPTTPGTVNGCPEPTVDPPAPASNHGDRDGDGVPNTEDGCPTSPGTVNGCPVAPADPAPTTSTDPTATPTDPDGDGIPSKQDGDRDGDGVPNPEDNCPKEPGPGDGCPDPPADVTPGSPTVADRDGDGVPNTKDRDRDGDGVLNRDDGCPTRVGAVDGCPADEPPELGFAFPDPVAP